jgi:hypothetical protein
MPGLSEDEQRPSGDFRNRSALHSSFRRGKQKPDFRKMVGERLVN